MSLEGPKLKNDETFAKRLKALEKFEYGLEHITGAGAVSVSTPISFITSSGAIALTLANGIEGQIKEVKMISDGGDATLTPASFEDSTITFDNDDSWRGIFYAGSWRTLGTPTATVA